MPSADTLPAVAARATYRQQRGDGGGAVGVGSVSWRRVGTRARHLALALADHGIGTGCRVDVRLAPSADAVAAELGVACTGATVGVDRRPRAGLFPPSSVPGRPTEGLRFTSAGLTGAAGTESIAQLVVRGAAVDAAGPDRFEGLVAAIDPLGVFIEERDEHGGRLRLDHLGAARILDSLTRALDRPAADRADLVLVHGGWASAAERLLAVWWPLIRGASTCVASGTGLAERLVGTRATIVVASGQAWTDVAEAVRADRSIGRGSRFERLVLGNGRALVAGEPVGRLARAHRSIAARTVLPRVRDQVGLGSCRRAVAVGPLAESVRRDLLAVGVPLSTAWTPDGAASPVTMTDPGSPDRSAGRPLPGWSVAVDRGGSVTVDGPGASSLVTHRRGRLDDAGRLWLRDGRS